MKHPLGKVLLKIAMSGSKCSDPILAALLDQSYKVQEIETIVFKKKQKEATCNEMFAKYICDAMNESNFKHNLKKLYNEAVYGCDLEVRRRMIKRIYLIRAKVA